MQVYNRMRRSPYRTYLEGEIYDPREIVYYKLIDTQENLARILIELAKDTESEVRRLRPVIRPQRNIQGLFGLYLYSDQTSVDAARKILMEMLRSEEPGLTEQEVKLRRQFRSDRDAIHLLHTVEDYYEPVKLPFAGRKKTKKTAPERDR